MADAEGGKWEERVPRLLFKVFPQLADLFEEAFGLRIGLFAASGFLEFVAAANLSLGSSNPKKIHLERLTRTQFEAVLTDPTNDQEAIQLWVRRIIRRHENEFPVRQAAG